jgi:hypothetical protein
MKGRKKPGLLVNFGQNPCSWIRIRIPNTDPNPGQRNPCGSGSSTLVPRKPFNLGKTISLQEKPIK